MKNFTVAKHVTDRPWRSRVLEEVEDHILQSCVDSYGNSSGSCIEDHAKDLT